MAGTVLKSNNAEIGLANGATVNTANSSGGGQDGMSVNAGAGNTFTVSSTSPLSGTFSYVLVQTGAVNCEFQIALAATVTDFSYQMEFVHATPAVHMPILRTWQTLLFGTASVTVSARTDNKFHIFDTTSSTQSPASTGALTPGTTYVMQFRQNGATVNFDIYVKGSTTKTVTITMTVGTVSVGSCRSGISVASALVTLKVDNIKVGTGGMLARTDVSNVAPTASVGPDQYVLVGSTVSLTGTDSDSDGTVASRLWSWSTVDTSGPASTTRKWATGPTITGATTQNASAVMATPGAYRAKYVVTDDAASDSADVFCQVFVYPASGAVIAVRNALKGSWTRVSGSDDTAVLINGESDTTGHLSPDDPTGQADTFLMMPHGPGRSSGAVTFVVRGNSSGAGGGVSRLVEWYKSDGTTLLGSHTQTAPSTIGNQTFILPGAGLTALGTALSDSAELVVKLKSTAL